MVYNDCGNAVFLNELESLIKNQIEKAESTKRTKFVYPKEAVRLTPGSCLVDPHFNSFVCKAVGELCIKLDEIIGEAVHPEYGSVRISAMVRDLERRVRNTYSQFTEKGCKITNHPPVSIKLGSVYAWAREQSGVDFNGLQMCSDLRKNRLRLCRKLCRLVRLSKSSKQRSKSHPLLSSLKHDLMKIRSRAAGKVFSERPVTLTSHTPVHTKPIRFTEDPFVLFEKPIIQSKLAIIFDKLADQITDLLLPISHLIPGISIVKSADDIGKRRENLRAQIVLAIQGFYCHFNETTDEDNDDNDPSIDDPMNGSSNMPDPSESSSDDEDITGAKLTVQMNPAIVQASLDRYDHFNWNKQKKFSSIRAKEQAIDQFSGGSHNTSRQQGSLFKSRCKIELSDPIIHNTEEVSAVSAAVATTTTTTTTTSQINQCEDDENLKNTDNIEGEPNDVPMDDAVQHDEGTEEKDESRTEHPEEGEAEEEEEEGQHQQQDEQLSQEQEEEEQQKEQQEQLELEEEKVESHSTPKHNNNNNDNNNNKLTEISRKPLNRSLRSRHSHTPTDTSCSEGEVLSDTEEDQELSDQHHHQHRRHPHRDNVNDPDQQNHHDDDIVGVHEKVKPIGSENQNGDFIRLATGHPHHHDDTLQSSSTAETTTTTAAPSETTTTTTLAPMNDVNLTELEIMNEWAQPTISTANRLDISLSDINLPSDEPTDADKSINTTTTTNDSDDENDEIRRIFNESLEFCAIHLQELISQAEINSNRLSAKVNRNASQHTMMNSTNRWPIVSISPELEASIERTATAFTEHVTSVLANLLHAVPDQFSSKSEADTKLRNPRVAPRRQPIIARRGSRLRGMLLAYQKDTGKRQNSNSS
ncbi:unnamed protein product [Trichobilharzia szidati]|nr:unnamed protein product [Trichobilharzia szidati]